MKWLHWHCKTPNLRYKRQYYFDFGVISVHYSDEGVVVVGGGGVRNGAVKSCCQGKLWISRWPQSQWAEPQSLRVLIDLLSMSLLVKQPPDS